MKSSRVSALQLDANRKAALELGNQVGGLGGMERARGDEQDVVGADRAVLGVDGRALDDRQQVALHALARDVGAVGGLAAGDLVDLVDEDDARLLGAIDRLVRDLLHVDQARGFFLREQLERFGHLDLLALGSSWA